MKIVDDSFNYKTRIKDKNLKFHKYFVVNFYNRDKKNLPTVEKIGDVIRLKRFRAKIGYNGEMFLKRNVMSNWLVYNGQGKCTSYLELKNGKNKNRRVTEEEKKRMVKLREWSGKFFRENSIKYYTWWTENKSGLGKRTGGNREFDLICEVKSNGSVAKLVGQDKCNWTMKHPLKCGKYVVVNGIHANGSEIVATTHWGYLTLPNDSYDIKHFVRKTKIAPKTEKSKSKSVDKTKAKSAGKSSDEYQIMSVNMLGKSLIKRHCQKCNKSFRELQTVKCAKCKGKLPLVYSISMRVKNKDSGEKLTVFVLGSPTHNPLSSLNAPSLKNEKEWTSMNSKKLKDLTANVMKLKMSTKKMKFTSQSFLGKNCHVLQSMN